MCPETYSVAGQVSQLVVKPLTFTGLIKGGSHRKVHRSHNSRIRITSRSELVSTCCHFVIGCRGNQLSLLQSLTSNHSTVSGCSSCRTSPPVLTAEGFVLSPTPGITGTIQSQHIPQFHLHRSTSNPTQQPEVVAQSDEFVFHCRLISTCVTKQYPFTLLCGLFSWTTRKVWCP